MSVQNQLRQQIDKCKHGKGGDKLNPVESGQIFVSADDGICLIDKEFKVLWINDVLCSQLKISKDSALGKKCYTVFDQATCRSHPCPITLIFNGEKFSRCDMVLRAKGINISCTLMAASFKGIDGEPIMILNFKRARREMGEKEFTKIDKLISFGNLAGSIAVDFNEILNDIMKNLSLIKLQVKPENDLFELLKETEKVFQKAKNANQRLMRIPSHRITAISK